MGVTVLLALSGVYGSSDVRVWLMTAEVCLNVGGRLGGCPWGRVVEEGIAEKARFVVA